MTRGRRAAGQRMPGKAAVRLRHAGLVAAGLAIGILATLLVPTIVTWRPGRLGEPVDLVVLSGRDSSGARAARIDAWNVSARTWNDTHPRDRRPTVTVVWLPDSANEQLAEMLRRARNPKPDVDVYVLDVPWTRQFVTSAYIRALDTSVEPDEFLERPLNTCRDGGHLYALPLNTDAGLLFRKPGMPAVRSWDALVTSSRSASSRSASSRGASSPSAFVGQFGQGEAFVVNVLEGILARGGKILDEDPSTGATRLRPAGEGVASALQSLSKDLHDPARIPAQADAYDEGATLRAFRENPVAYMRNWPAFAPRQGEQLAPGIQVSRLPWRSVLGGQNLAVSSKSRHTREATAFIEWLSDEASQTHLFQDGGFAPTRRALYLDPRIHGSDEKQTQDTTALLTAIDVTVSSAVRRPDVPNYPLFSEVFQDVMRHALNNNGILAPADIQRLDAATEGKYLPVAG